MSPQSVKSNFCGSMQQLPELKILPFTSRTRQNSHFSPFRLNLRRDHTQGFFGEFRIINSDKRIIASHFTAIHCIAELKMKSCCQSCL